MDGAFCIPNSGIRIAGSVSSESEADHQTMMMANNTLCAWLKKIQPSQKAEHEPDLTSQTIQ
jgi:hypothetical protein